MDEQEIKTKFEEIERRLDSLENKPERKESSIKNLTGIQGGVQEMIKEGFFNTPKTTPESKIELERKGHFYELKRIDTVIRRDFFKNKKIFTRIKRENGKWSYVVKK